MVLVSVVPVLVVLVEVWLARVEGQLTRPEEVVAREEEITLGITLVNIRQKRSSKEVFQVGFGTNQRSTAARSFIQQYLVLNIFTSFIYGS